MQRFCIKLVTSELSNRAGEVPAHPMDCAISPVVTTTVKSKIKTYSHLMKLAIHVYEHKRAKLPPPKFFPLAVSAFGEWSGSLFDFVNDATKHFSSYAAYATWFLRVTS